MGNGIFTMGNVYNEAQKKASEKYAQSTDLIRIRCEKGKTDKIKQYAEKHGMTYGEFVNKAINLVMEEDLLEERE